MSKATTQKSSDDPTLNYAVFYIAFFTLGFLTGILRRIIYTFFPALKRSVKQMPQKTKVEESKVTVDTEMSTELPCWIPDAEMTHNLASFMNRNH